MKPITETTLTWCGLDHISSTENCHIEASGSGYRIASQLTGLQEGIHYQCSFVISTDGEWQTTSVHITTTIERKVHELSLNRASSYGWIKENQLVPELKDCVDIDISVSPFTNTLPINRLPMETGKPYEIAVAYIDVLNQTISREVQTYTRIDEFHYLFETSSGDFKAEIAVDNLGFVVDYPPLFTRK